MLSLTLRLEWVKIPPWWFAIKHCTCLHTISDVFNHLDYNLEKSFRLKLAAKVYVNRLLEDHFHNFRIFTLKPQGIIFALFYQMF